MASPYLSQDEVKERLAIYEDDKITEELYGFGTMLINNAVQRFARLNATVGLTVAYCAGLITMLISTATVWTKGVGQWERLLPIGAGAIAGLAAAIAISGMTLRNIDWFSQDDWMNAACLRDSRKLKKFHILSMWRVVDSYGSAYQTKSGRVKRAQQLTALAAALLFATLLKVTWTLSFV
jgi:hypothetical protein